MNEKVQKYIFENQLFNKNDKILVAVSGGIDSIVLMHLLLYLGYNCIAAHCNFHLRGEESDGDERFVEDWTKTHSVLLLKTNFDTVQYADEHKISIEMAARELRYEWLEEMRKQNNCSCIAIAHHADDSIETVMLNIARGTGLNGLTGIKSKNGFVVRPLLCCFRSDIEEYAQKEHLNFRFDSSNNDEKYKRNLVRHQIIPKLKELNPNFGKTMSENISHFANAYKIYSTYMDSFCNSLIIKTDYGYKISIHELKENTCSKQILYEILHRYGFGADISDSVFQHLDSESGKQFFSQSHRIIKDRNFILIKKIESAKCECYHIKDSDSEIKNPFEMQISRHSITDFNILKEKNIACIDADKLNFPLTLRRWKKGDRFFPFGMKESKKISDYFSDNKYSLIDKEHAWILTDTKDVIVWLVGERIDNRFRITKKTQNILLLKCSPKSIK